MNSRLQSKYHFEFGYGCPSASPTISSAPSQSDPARDFVFIDVGNDQRRYFPKRSDSLDGKVTVQPAPDCSELRRHVGCLAIPISFRSSSPIWAGKMHFKPPDCSDSVEGISGSCKASPGPLTLSMAMSSCGLSLNSMGSSRER